MIDQRDIIFDVTLFLKSTHNLLCTVQSNKSPLEVATEVAEEADEYNGFNLILADLTTNIMVYVSNRPKGQPATIQLVSPGLHVLSNARLDSPWQKVRALSVSCSSSTEDS
jgi:uncharacterized protein with NRDE domain